MPELDDRAAVIDVINAYAWALDSKDYAALRDVFFTDASADYGLERPLEGSTAVVNFMTRAHEHIERTQHFLGNHTVSVDGDRAQSRTYFRATLLRRGAPGGDRFEVGGYYLDDLIRTVEGWRIQRRIVKVVFTEGNRALITQSAAGG